MSNEEKVKSEKNKHRFLKGVVFGMFIGIMIYCIYLLIPYIFLMGGAF